MSKRTPLMYHNGNSWKFLESYVEENMNVGIFVGGGPSLNKIDISKLSGSGKTVVGVNTTYPKVRPDIWVGMDEPSCYDEHVYKESFPKILRGGLHERILDGRKLYEYPFTYFGNMFPTKEPMDIFECASPESENIIWEKNVFSTTMNIMLHMGFKKIYLAGVDFEVSDKSYFDGREMTKDQDAWNMNLYNHLYHYLDWFSKECMKRGIEIFSISPDSKINDLVPYVNLDDLNQNLDLPNQTELKHSSAFFTEHLVSDDYMTLLKSEHKTQHWGTSAGAMIDTLHNWLLSNDAKEVLDYGCGSSSFKNNIPKDAPYKVYEYDPGIEGKEGVQTPKDFLICIDVLEHVEPNLIDNVIKQIADSIKIQGYLTIAMYPAMRILQDGRNAHLIIEDMPWWVNKLSQYLSILSITKTNQQLDVIVENKK
jgi:hypothetical protein